MVSVGLLRIASKLIHDISYPHDELKELSIELGLLAKTSKNQSYYAIVSSKDDVPDGLLCFNKPSTNNLVIGSIQSGMRLIVEQVLSVDLGFQDLRQFLVTSSSL